jgi:hypothetical protein
MYYNKLFKVKVWVVLEDLSKKLNSELIDFFKKAEAHIVSWPAPYFVDTIKLLRSRGWEHEFESEGSGKLVLSPQFLNYAFTYHLKTINPHTLITNDVERPVNTINREVVSEKDYERMFNEMMEIFSPISLSMTFNIGQLCHGNDKQVKVFVSEGEIPDLSIRKLADNVIRIKKEGGDISTKSQKTEEIIDNIVTLIQKII